MAGSSRSLLTALGIILLGLPSLAAQGRAAGRVVRLVAGDTLPVGGIPVALHRVGRAAQGPIDTVRADARGRFGFRFAPDSAAAYLLSVRYHGIEYFSQPIARNPALPDTALVIIVADTSSTVAVTTGERTLLISRPDESGTRAVVDWLVLENRGERTRVAPDSSRPSWSAPLPPEAQNVELADARLSQFSPDALEFRGDSVLVFAPLSPGEKELVLQYRIPGSLRRFSVPAAEGTDSLFVLLEDPRARVASPSLAIADTQRLEGRLFRRFAGRTGGVAAIEISFPAAPVSPGVVLAVLVTLSGLAFAALAALLLKRRALPQGRHPLDLADQIARLDAAQLLRGEPDSAEQRERYLAERARLVAALARALAATRPGS